MTNRHAFLSFLLGLGLFACGDAAVREDDPEWGEPTTGLITTVEEVEPGDYKIASEEVVPTVPDSRIIANSLDGTSDTFTLAEAQRLEQTLPDTSRQRSYFRSAGLGYWGFLMLGRIGGGTPAAGAYVNNQAYNRTNNVTGNRMRTSARAARGFGAGKSTRSFGG